MKYSLMKVLLANPRGFCAGVDRAIEIVNLVLEHISHPVYVRHEVVHNTYVVKNLRRCGAIFIDKLNSIPKGSTVIFSAHGVSQDVQAEARERNLRVFDATCPLVTKVHLEVARHCHEGRSVVLIGHRGHPEVEGTLGQYNSNKSNGNIFLIESINDVMSLKIPPSNQKQLSYVTQTTLSIEDTAIIIKALKERFPTIVAPNKSDICYATQNRQDAVKKLARQSDLVLVVGSPNSSNSNRLREVAEKQGTKSHLIECAEDINLKWLSNIKNIGITAGASAPEVLVKRIILYLEQFGTVKIDSLKGCREKIIFAIPQNLRSLI